MNIYNLIKRKKKSNFDDRTKITIKDDRTKIIIKDGRIPNSDVFKTLNNKIAFIVISSDEKVLQASTEAIINFQKENQDKDITVFISSSYEKLHRLTKGAI